MSPKELVQHKTHLRKVSCYIGDNAPDTKNLEMMPEVNVNVKMTQNAVQCTTPPSQEESTH